MTDISGRVALVTGGGSGIGRALAISLAEKGSPVIVADIALERSSAVAEEIKAAGGKAFAVACDVSDRASVGQMRDAAIAAFGPPTLIFANAGVTAFDPIEDMTPSDIDWIIEVNLFGVIHCIEAFLPDLKAAGGGHFVATSSMAGLIPQRIPFHAPYVAAKMGIIALMLSMNTDYAKDGIGFTVLCPGGVTGRMAESPTVRPDRFGGPGAPMGSHEEVIVRNNIQFRPAEEAAAMTLRAVENNREMVLTDHLRRDFFSQLYVGAVTQAFDDAEAFQQELDAAK